MGGGVTETYDTCPDVYKRELRRPENEQVLSAVATHSRPSLLGIYDKTKY